MVGDCYIILPNQDTMPRKSSKGISSGKFYAICDNMIMESIVFERGIYPSAVGLTAIKLLECVLTTTHFIKVVEKFNNDNYKYPPYPSLIFPKKKSRYVKSDGNIYMTNRNYFKLYFVDWTYWKNLSRRTVKIYTRDKGVITLKPQEHVALYFGYKENHYASSKECELMIMRELSHLSNLP